MIWYLIPVYIALSILLALAIGRALPLADPAIRCASCDDEVNDQNSAEFRGPVPAVGTPGRVGVRFRVCHRCLQAAS